MYARIVKFEGADSAALDAIRDAINSADGPPPGVPATRIVVLGNRESGASYTIVFFDNEEDLRTGDAALNDMQPITDSPGTRAWVDLCEVLVEREDGDAG
jgi:hypothetical protein